MVRSALFLTGAAIGWGGEDESPLPFDPAVLRGTFDNGVTYYIRHNAKPKGRLDLRLVVRAGSVLEADDQQGLAHALEHMAFNGTQHFEHRQLVDFLESIGMRFGPELNAYTSFDETVYRLQVPTDRLDVVDRAFLILRDWAFGVANRDDEIERERRVLIEEWRLGRGADQRIRDRQVPVAFWGSRYAERLPIGKKEVLESFPPDRLRAFYRDWYRPELMAVVAVGDLETDALLGYIRKHFAKERRRDGPERLRHPVPDHPDTLVNVTTDKEAARSTLSVLFKRVRRPLKTRGDYRAYLIEMLAQKALNERLDEHRRKAKPPFLRARLYRQGLGPAKEAWVLSAEVQDAGFSRGLDVMLREAHRMRQHGITESELARAKAEIRAHAEKAFRERETTESAVWVAECVQNFLFGDVSPGVEEEWRLHERLLPGITRPEVTAAVTAWFAPSNRVVLASGPEKPGLTVPTADDLLAVIRRVEETPTVAYVDESAAEPLLDTLPAAGSITNRQSLAELGVTIWELSNGVTVLIKPTVFRKEEILFSGFLPGGHSVVSDEDFIPARSAVAILNDSGWGRFSAVQLRRKLAGRILRVGPSLDELRHGLKGSTRREDLEIALQVAYLALTAPRRDEEAFEAYRERTRTHLLNRLAKPELFFSDTVQRVFYADHLRKRPWDLAVLDKLNLDRSLRVYAERFGSCRGLTWIFVGDLDVQAVEPWVCRYLGGLPAERPATPWKDHGIRPVQGCVHHLVVKGQDPKSRVLMFFHGDFPWSVDERHRFSSLLRALNIRLRERIREEEGGTYSIWASGWTERYPVPAFQIRIGFGCAPSRVPELMASVRAVVDGLCTNRLSDVELTKVKETQLREHEVALERNEFWLQTLDFCRWNGEDPRAVILGFPKRVEALSADDIRRAADRYLATNNFATFVLRPESVPSEP